MASSEKSSWLSLAMGSSPRSGDSADVSICDEFHSLLQEMSNGKLSSVSPQTFFSTIWKVLPIFKGYRQQDAQEFMRCLLDRMDHELRQKNKRRTMETSSGVSPMKTDKMKTDEESETEIQRIFGGLLQNEITCLKCGYLSRKDDPFLDLSLDIPEPETKDSVTLMDCLKSFTDVEMLEDSEKYNCERCGSLQRISKKFTIKKAPEVSVFLSFPNTFQRLTL